MMCGKGLRNESSAGLICDYLQCPLALFLAPFLDQLSQRQVPESLTEH